MAAAMAEHTMPHESLPLVALQAVFRFLSGAEGGAAQCVARDWRDAAALDDTLWRGWLENDFCVQSPVGPSGEAHASHRAAYRAWRAHFRGYGQLAVRARRAWAAIERWLEQHLPAVELRPGASEEALRAVEERLGAALPRALRALYRCHDGQGGTDRSTQCLGVFGGYSAYDVLASVRMLRLEASAQTSDMLSQTEVLAGRPPTFILAASWNLGRLMVVDCGTGQPRVMTSMAEFVDCVPPDKGAADGVLRWVEAWAERLQRGYYLADALVPGIPRSRGICLYPRAPPGQVEAVTAGVRVRVAPLLMPEASRPSAGLLRFAYCVRFALLEGAAPGGAGSCQLQSRHWVIRDAQGRVVDEVQGPGVIGQYPLLRPGEPDYWYCSCTAREGDHGASMEGGFTFVPGSLQAPAGPPFEVECPRFSLEMPDFIF